MKTRVQEDLWRLPGYTEELQGLCGVPEEVFDAFWDASGAPFWPFQRLLGSSGASLGSQEVSQDHLFLMFFSMCNKMTQILEI